MPHLIDSQTRLNLMRAFAGESQARNRYTFAASLAKQQKLHVVEAVFTYTANQEKEHAEIFYNLLKECSGENICVDGTYPVDLADSPSQLLRFAQRNEYDEYNHAYARFSTIAKQEGFARIAEVFDGIAKIEKTHGDRFGRYADLMDANQLFTSGLPIEWLCLNCGHVHYGTDAPQICPICSHDQGYFLRLDLLPFRQG